MTRFARWGFALALLPIAACSSNTPAPMMASPAPAPMMPAANPADSAFVTAAAQSDLFEQQTSQLALTRARTPAVKSFAQMMIDAHTQSTSRLAGIAQAKGIMLPTALDSDQQPMLDSLNGMPTGATFQRSYLRAQVMGHQKTLAVMQNYAANGTDPDLKAFASDMIPVIQRHLAAARRLSGARR